MIQDDQNMILEEGGGQEITETDLQWENYR